MTDFSKIRGDIQPPKPERGKQREKHEVDEIKEKWSKVGKVDPDQRKQKKPKAQKEAEAEAEYTAPRQGLGAEPGVGSSIYEPEGGGLAIPEGGGAVSGTSPSYGPPSDNLESEIIPEQQPQQDQKKTEERQPIPPTRRTERKKVAGGKPTEKKGAGVGVKAKAPTPTEGTKKGEILTGKKPPAHAKRTEIKGEEKKGMLQGAFEPTAKGKKGVEGKGQIEKKEEVIPEEAVPPPPPLPEGAWEAMTEKERKEVKEKPKEGAETPLTTALPEKVPSMGAPPPTQAGATTPVSAPFANLPPQVQQLYERMVGVMTVMHETGVTQTTINLDNPRFSNSAFFGTQIIITEFSTAPKAFNIELLGNQQAVNLISQNTEELLAAFQTGQYNFKVNRIDTGYLPGLGELRRKEARRVKRKKT